MDIPEFSGTQMAAHRSTSRRQSPLRRPQRSGTWPDHPQRALLRPAPCDRFLHCQRRRWCPMALARTYSMALAGVCGHVVEIEADIENGLVALLLVGLPDTALREARDRIRSAIVNSQRPWPQRRITVGLSPASLPKRGSGFDLGIAVAVLSADGVLPKVGLAGTVFLGELGLDGRIRPVPGILPCIAAAAAAGFGRAVVPPQNAAEAALVPAMQEIGR